MIKSNLYLSHDFGLQIYSINLGLSPRYDISDAEQYRYGTLIENASNRYSIELSVECFVNILDEDFDENKIASAFGERLVVITGGLIYQLKDWVVKEVTMSSNTSMGIVITADSIDKNGKISVLFTDGKYDIDPSDYLNVYNVYGLLKQFTYDEFIVRALSVRL